MRLQFFSRLISIIVLLTSIARAADNNQHNWDWKTRDTSKVVFPKTFRWGAAICEYQNSGANQCPDNNWAVWEQGKGNIKHEQKSGVSCDHWNRYPEDIKLMQDLGLNSFRFSVEWSKIEPKRGVLDQAALDHYKQELIALRKAGISPMVTLHHFTLPQWFEELGAFEKDENIDLFVSFCEKVFDALHDYVDFWCTINEPGIYVFQGYTRGVFPPGHHDTATGGVVLKNLLRAHVRVYKSLKAREGGKKAQIGIVHQHLVFEAYNKDSCIEKALTEYISHIVTESSLEFLMTGKFKFTAVPFMDLMLGGLTFPLLSLTETVEYEDLSAPRAMDFIGVNYYSRVLFNLKKGGVFYLPDDIVTDMPYAMYGEGLYHIIKRLSSMGLPIYVTENGIADSRDDRRQLWIERYLYAVSEAIKDGCDVRGYYYWTLTDNFEWDEGREMMFGLATKDRQIRKGSLALTRVARQSKNHA